MNRCLFEFKKWEQAAVLQSILASEVVDESPPVSGPGGFAVLTWLIVMIVGLQLLSFGI